FKMLRYLEMLHIPDMGADKNLSVPPDGKGVFLLGAEGDDVVDRMARLQRIGNKTAGPAVKHKLSVDYLHDRIIDRMENFSVIGKDIICDAVQIRKSFFVFIKHRQSGRV